MEHRTLIEITNAIGRNDKLGAAALILSALENEPGKGWRENLTKLADFLLGDWPPFSVWVKGNSKLPFWSLSGLPGIPFCAGAGDCLDVCYSFRAWRFPAAFCRQVQNQVLLQSESGRAFIAWALDQVLRKSSGPVTLRLFVDGDFSNVEQLQWAMETLRDRPDVRAYGYSKSFLQFLELHARGFDWPENYLLNLSAGHCHSFEVEQMMLSIPVTRGTYAYVDTGRKARASDHGTRETNKKLRAAFGARAFTCPGQCGQCLPGGQHACGSERFRNVPIIISAH